MFLHLRLNGTLFLFAPIGLVDRYLDRRPVLGELGMAQGETRGLMQVEGERRGASRNVAKCS